MTRGEIYPNPTVKQVIFQIRFPSLFSIETLIGDYQIRIMEMFPNSQLLHSRRFMFSSEEELKQAKEEVEEQKLGAIKKIWKFTTESGVVLSVTVDSLDISSEVHKTYNNPKGDERFREIIDFVLKNFFEITKIPKINRLGLRYIDECPVPSRGNASFRKYYNTKLPIDRFKLKDAIEIMFLSRARRGKYYFTFREAFSETSGKPVLTLDFDGYAQNIKSGEYLAVTDKLHELISAEYEAHIKEPVRRYMRKRTNK